MAKYKFRLETLQKLRIARRDQLRSSLAEAFRAEQVLAEQRAALVKEATELTELQRSAAAGPYLDVNRLLEVQRYALVLKAREQELTRQNALLTAEIERRRLALVEADRDVRALELLDERQHGEHRRRQGRREIAALDEAAINRQTRREPVNPTW